MKNSNGNVFRSYELRIDFRRHALSDNGIGIARSNNLHPPGIGHPVRSCHQGYAVGHRHHRSGVHWHCSGVRNGRLVIRWNAKGNGIPLQMMATVGQLKGTRNFNV